MENSKNQTQQTNDVGIIIPPKAILSLILIIGLILASSLYFNWILDQKMTAICQNFSMEYLYRDSGSFYCLSTNGTIKLKEIQYR